MTRSQRSGEDPMGAENPGRPSPARFLPKTRRGRRLRRLSTGLLRAVGIHRLPETRRERWLRQVSTVLLWAFGIQLLVPAPVWASPPPRAGGESASPQVLRTQEARVDPALQNPLIQKVLSESGAGLRNPLPGGLPGAPGAEYFPQVLRPSIVQVAQSPDSAPAGEPAADASSSTGPKSPAVAPSPSPVGPPPWAQSKDKPSAGSARGDSSHLGEGPKHRDRRGDDDGNSRHHDRDDDDCDGRVDDDDDDDNGHHGKPRPKKPKGLASVVLAPEEERHGLYAPTSAEFARQGHPEGHPYEMEVVDGKPQAYSSDYAVVLSRSFAELAQKETIRFDLYSGLEQEDSNCTARRTAASAEWRYREEGPENTPSATNAAYCLELKVWDKRHPGGRVVLRTRDKTQLPRLELFVGVAARDLTDYRWVVTRNNQRVSEKQFRVVDPPATGGPGWTRRNEGEYRPPPALAPVVAYVNDEWLLRTEEFSLPQPRREPRRGSALDDPLAKKVTWTWQAPAASRMNVNGQRGYYTVENKYWSNNMSCQIETRAWEPLYPKGRLLRVRSGSGRLKTMTLTEGMGLGPVFGAWKFQAQVDGKKSSEKISVRNVALDAGAPAAWGGRLLGLGTSTFEMTVKSQGWVPSEWTWTLRVKNIHTGQLLATLTGQVTGNTEATRHFYTNWNGQQDNGERVMPGTGVFGELEVQFPPGSVETAAARARSSASQVALAPAVQPTPALTTRQIGPCVPTFDGCSCDCPPKDTVYNSPIAIQVSNAKGTTTHHFTDLVVPTKGLPLILSRYHASDADRSLHSETEREIPFDQEGLAGLAVRGGWNFSFHHRILPQVANNLNVIIYHKPNGGYDKFVPNPNGGAGGNDYVGIHGNTATLERSDNVWTLTFRNKTRFLFSREHGYLIQQIDRNGNTNRFIWTPGFAPNSWKLDRMEGPHGQYINFEWQQGQPRPIPTPLPNPTPTPWLGGPTVGLPTPARPSRSIASAPGFPPPPTLTAIDHKGRTVKYEWSEHPFSILDRPRGAVLPPVLTRVTQPMGTLLEYAYGGNALLVQTALREIRLNGVLQEKVITNENGVLDTVSHPLPHGVPLVPPTEFRTLRFRDFYRRPDNPKLLTQFTETARNSTRTWSYHLHHQGWVESAEDALGHVTHYVRHAGDDNPAQGLFKHFLYEVYDPRQAAVNGTEGGLPNPVKITYHPDKNLKCQ